MMPIYTSGGTVRIDGAYTEVGRDMYTYPGDTHVNSHNVEKTTISDSYNDSSVNKESRTLPFLVFIFCILSDFGCLRIENSSLRVLQSGPLIRRTQLVVFI
jgi:hypothetical protein